MFELYLMQGCPYCEKVVSVCDRLKLSFVRHPYKREWGEENEAFKVGGKMQVPLLVDGDTVMYESGDIIEYLEKKYA